MDYSTVIELNLDTVNPAVAGPKRPQDRIELSNLDDRFLELFTKSVSEGAYGKIAEDLDRRFSVSMGSHSVGMVVGGGEQISKSIPDPFTIPFRRPIPTLGLRSRWSITVRHRTVLSMTRLTPRP